MSQLNLFFLGPPRFERAEVSLALKTRKATALMVYLTMTGQTHNRETLATLFWPDYEPTRSRAYLRRALWLLKKNLGATVLTLEQGHVGLNSAASFRLDVADFRRLLASCEAHSHTADAICPACLPPLVEAAALYQNDFLAGFSLSDCPIFDEWQFFQTETLRQALASILERLVRGYTAQGDYEAAIPYARRWLRIDSLRESVHRTLMQLYAWSGQMAAAQRQYEDCARLLAEELDAPPAPETEALYQAIKSKRVSPPAGLQVQIDGRVSGPPGSLTENHTGPSQPSQTTAEAEYDAPGRQTAGFSSSRSHNLPAQTTAFIGREVELAELGRLFDFTDVPTTRLITITGPGGMGKTRLALATATAQRNRFAGGVYFIPLASLTDAENIIPTIAHGVGVSFQTDQGQLKEQLLDFFRQKERLLVLDNFDHLPAGIPLINDILQAAPAIRVLVTSRTRLKLRSETVFAMTGLALPEPDRPIAPRPGVVQPETDAIKLFVQGARQVQPDFILQPADFPHVARICHLVGGMPLGILLAAAWVEMLRPADIVAEMEQDLDLLATDLADVPERQRTIRSVFDYSWQLLTEQEQNICRQLAVFQGSFTRQAAQAITGASLRTLMALVSKSLLNRTPAGRFEIHELLRQYAAEHLQAAAQADEARDAHSAYYLRRLHQDEIARQEERPAPPLSEVAADLENIRAAWAWAAARKKICQDDQTAQVIEGLSHFYYQQKRFSEGKAAFRLAAEKLTPPTSPAERRLLARILVQQSIFGLTLGHTEQAVQLLQKSLSLLDSPDLAAQDIRQDRAFVLQALSSAVSILGDLEAGRQLAAQSLALFRETGHREGQVGALRKLGWEAMNACRFEEAKQLFTEGLAIRRRLPQQRGIEGELVALGWVSLYQGLLAESERFMKEGLEILQEAGSPFALAHLGQIYLYQGRFTESMDLYQEVLARCHEREAPFNIALYNLWSGRAKMHQGHYEAAQQHLYKGLALVQKAGDQWTIGGARSLLGQVALATGAHDEAQASFQETLTILQKMAQPALESSMTYTYLGYAAWGLGNISQTRCYLVEALQIAVTGKVWTTLIELLPLIALFLISLEDEQAIEIYALASRYPYVAQSQWFKDVAGRQITEMTAALPPEVVATAQERGQIRDLWATAGALLVALAGEKA